MKTNVLSVLRSISIFFLVVLLAACGEKSGGSGSSTSTTTTTSTAPPAVEKEMLNFNSDSAYAYVKEQLDFGTRVPGSEGHKACGDWLSAKLDAFSDKLYEQTSEVTTWDGKVVPMRNIIGSFRPDADLRVLLCAHWDTRPYADEDTERTDEPIPGANDGGSGVGVLLEIARQLSQNPSSLPPNWGVDIVLFDVEDYGWSAVRDSYCLGSQYWAKQPHVTGYTADYGILLDMVGAKGAYFYKEGISMRFAPHIVRRVWDAAAAAGYRDYFWFNEAPYPELTDDHLYVNTLAGIPTIDIIQYDQQTEKGFFHHWHTHQDDLSIIDPATLKAVGQTVLNVILEN